MATTMLDSVVYGSLWSRGDLRELFDEPQRMRAWLEILAVLAEVEGELELVPGPAAARIAETCRGVEVDREFLDEVRRGREESGHSTWGLNRAIQRRCPGDAGQWLHYGAAVQDLSDTWLMLALRSARLAFAADLAKLDAELADLAVRHRGTLMAGRTHGQPGLPITFGFKVAGWLAELRRHRERLGEMAARMDVGQLGGGVGTLSALGPRALEVRARFCERLGLRPPQISWTSSRDVLAEWCHWLALVTAMADRIAHEVYNLQRPELGELSEGFRKGAVGSITMPHKRNPEIAEHLGTLARGVRHHAACVAEGMVHDHERDGRSWKAEWQAVPECTLLAGKALELLLELVANLVVHPERMRENLEATRGFVLSEAVMLALARHVGRETAHRLVYEIAIAARDSGQHLRDAVLASRPIMTHLSGAEVEEVFDYAAHTGQAAAMVEQVTRGGS